MTKTVIQTSNAPEAVGPYSQATSANGLVFCSGQIPLDPASGELVVASAGHLPVLVLDGDGGRLVDAGRGPALGMVSGATYGEARLRLQGDDRLVVFSDGLVELRGEDLEHGLDAMARLAASGPRDADALLDRLLAGLAPDDTDDVTVLALGPAS